MNATACVPAANAGLTAPERLQSGAGPASAPLAHAAQTQRRPRAACGMRSSSSALKLCALHQHGGCGVPVARSISIAHWLGCPHRGHNRGLVSGINGMACWQPHTSQKAQRRRVQQGRKSTMIAGEHFRRSTFTHYGRHQTFLCHDRHRLAGIGRCPCDKAQDRSRALQRIKGSTWQLQR